MKRLLFAFANTFIITTTALGATGPCVVAGQGHFRIHVGTAGLFGAFAHDHLIEAQRILGCATLDSKDITNSSIKLTFATAGLRVIDAKVSDKNRAEIQRTMETEVLRVSGYPEITFESTAIESGGGPDQLRVKGNLTIRGKTQPVIIPLTLTRMADGIYHALGKYSFKQTAFGIRPVQLAGGTIKVKDELQTEFEIFLR